MTKRTASFGAWTSPITAEQIAASHNAIRDLYHDHEKLYWLERRPTEGGRNVLVQRCTDGVVAAVLPAGYNVRTLVHEYGGGDYLPVAGGIFFSNFDDQRLYHFNGQPAQPVTPAGAARYADVVADSSRQRLIAVCEDHSGSGEAVNSLVAIDPVTTSVTPLAAGYDFYAAPRLSPDGRQLAWLCWRHPNMPWDGSELWLADIDESGQLANARLLAGDAHTSIGEPRWSPAGTLFFVSDASGWWNLYCWDGPDARSLHPMAAEFGGPAWQFGTRTYDFADDGTIICTYNQGGYSFVARLNIDTGRLTPLGSKSYARISNLHCAGGHAYFIAMRTDAPVAIVQLSLADGAVTDLHQEKSGPLFPGAISKPTSVTFPTTEGSAHGFYYPPQNDRFQAPAGSLPPLLVNSHGGPTGATDARLDKGIQFWTSRGFAFLDVNYRGSSGFGREYRCKINGQWGITDVEDCINGARYLVAQGLVDPQRLAIRGGSAGGYTTLCAVTFHNFFHAGASHFGLSELTLMAKETHKFESRYLDSLIGPFSKALYSARSPLPAADQINCPVIFFQGLEDPVVPANQSELMYQALKAKGMPTAYIGYPGERHGFRQARNIRHSLESELYFYGKVFGFEPAGDIEPIAIDNLS